MSSPIIFFSHSSHDTKPLTLLKELFVKKTGGSIDVFLSSDGQSIQFGRNWVHSVEQALDQAKLMLVFITPNSIRSNWIYFESGYAYAKGLRVVPIGLFGVDLSSVLPPISLLQGFNVTSEAGLGNIVAIANEVFGHCHPETFSTEEFSNLSLAANTRVDTLLGKHVTMIDQITAEIFAQDLANQSLSDAIGIVGNYLTNEKHQYVATSYKIDIAGVSFTTNNESNKLLVEIEPAVMSVVIPLVQKSLQIIRKEGLVGLRMLLYFIRGIDYIKGRHKITGKLFGTEVELADGNWLRFRGFEFEIFRPFDKRQTYYPVNLELNLLEDALSLPDLRDLLDLLSEREILYLMQ